MNEVYWGAYHKHDGLPVLQAEEMVIPPDRVPVPEGNDWHGAGSGWGSYAEPLKHRLGAHLSDSEAECFPTAASIATLAVPMFEQGGGVDAAQAIPVYLRDNVAKKSASR